MAFATHSEVNKKRSLNVKAPPIAGISIWAVWGEDRFTLDHRHGEQNISLASDPLSHSTCQHRQAMCLGMHCSMVIATSVREQSLALNGEKCAPKGVVGMVNRDWLTAFERQALSNPVRYLVLQRAEKSAN